MGDGGRSNVAAPTVFEGHGDAHADAEVTSLLGLGEATELADLEVHHVHGQVGLGPQQQVEAVYVFIQNERVIGLTAHCEALFVGEAGLLDVHVEVAHGPHHADGLMLGPTGVGVGH